MSWRMLVLIPLTLAACQSKAPADARACTATPGSGKVDCAVELYGGIDLSSSLHPTLFEYDYACGADVAPSQAPLSTAPPTEDCSDGIWPKLDYARTICPTFSSTTQQDPDTGATLPPADDRQLPLELSVSETGSFRKGSAPASWPKTLRVVAWNMEQSRSLDAQIEVLLKDPILSTADVYLLGEVDRCSQRSGVRRAARLIARRLEADYAYGVEYVELSIGRTEGGDTGQAIVSRRPLTGTGLTCLSQQYDWLSDSHEPRLGQRVAVQGDIPVGGHFVRLFATHLESRDVDGSLRLKQARELLDSAQHFAGERPIIVGGDLNAWYCTTPELEVFRRAGFIDATRAAGDTGGTHPGNGWRLDYLWARHFHVTGGGVVRDLKTSEGQRLSDHDPVWADLTVE